MPRPTYDRLAYLKAIKARPQAPRILSEGDSWFAYPLAVPLVTRLGGVIEKRTNWLRLEANGDQMRDILRRDRDAGSFDDEPIQRKFGGGSHQEKVLRGRLSDPLTRPAVLLLSAGGNDILAKGSPTQPGLADFLLPYGGPGLAPAARMNRPVFDAVLGRVFAAYRLLGTLRDECGARDTVLIAHTYCPCQPRPDSRPLGMKGSWLHRAFAARGYGQDFDAMLAVTTWMIGAFRDGLTALAPAIGRFEVVDLTDPAVALPPADPRAKGARNGLWSDEIHPSTAGFARLAEAFRPALRRAIPGHF